MNEALTARWLCVIIVLRSYGAAGVSGEVHEVVAAAAGSGRGGRVEGGAGRGAETTRAQLLRLRLETTPARVTYKRLHNYDNISTIAN